MRMSLVSSVHFIFSGLESKQILCLRYHWTCSWWWLWLLLLLLSFATTTPSSLVMCSRVPFAARDRLHVWVFATTLPFLSLLAIRWFSEMNEWDPIENATRWSSPQMRVQLQLVQWTRRKLTQTSHSTTKTQLPTRLHFTLLGLKWMRFEHADREQVFGPGLEHIDS